MIEGTSTWPPASSAKTQEEVETELAKPAAGQRKATPPKHTATPDKILPRTTEGSTAMSTTTTKKKAAAKKRPPKKSPPAKKATAKKAAPVKKATATKRPVGLDMRDLPHAIAWQSADGTISGSSNIGDWGAARWRLKSVLDGMKLKPQYVKDSLTNAAAHVAQGKSVTIHGIKITCPKR